MLVDSARSCGLRGEISCCSSRASDRRAVARLCLEMPRVHPQTLDAAAMRGLDWCDNELERTAVGILLQRLMQIYDTDSSPILAAMAARCILIKTREACAQPSKLFLREAE
jgi:hypothetical protein